MTDSRTVTDRLGAFLEGGRFPLFALCLMAAYEVLLLALLVAPGGETGLGAFADDFRVWCFGYDPATGSLDWAYVLGMTTPPLMLAATFVLLWLEPLRAALKRPWALAAPTGLAVALVAGAAGAFSLLGVTGASGELPFPADAIRTAHHAPEFSLTNQAGETVEVASLRGKVVMLTAIYASCPHTCPVILEQARNAIEELTPEERRDLRMVAVTMDPAHDSPEVLAELADMHGFETPVYNFVTGEPGRVNEILDSMSIARERDPDTGVIDHVNLFLILDREGKLAYRLGLGDRQQRWLLSALKVLLNEDPAEATNAG